MFNKIDEEEGKNKVGEVEFKKILKELLKHMECIMRPSRRKSSIRTGRHDTVLLKHIATISLSS